MSVADQVVALLRDAPALRARDIAADLKLPLRTVNDAVRSLRFAGKMDWNSLSLAPSMLMVADAPSPATPSAPAGGVAPPASPAPPQAQAVEQPVAAPAEVADVSAPATEAAEPVDVQIAKIATLQMLGEVAAYCEHTGTVETKIGSVLYRHPGFIGLVRHRGRTGPEKIAEVRQLMADHPGGLKDVPDMAVRDKAPKVEPPVTVPEPKPDAAPVPAPPPPAPAPPKRTVAPSATAKAMPLRERVDREFLAEPVDALSLLRRRWPALLDELVQLARRREQPVAEVVRDVIEGGLAKLAAKGGTR